MSSSPRSRALGLALHVVAFVAFGVCNYAAAGWLASLRGDRPAPACLGPANAARNVVYLHGLDSHGPSWQELDNRRALAALPDTRVAIPRAPSCGAGRCWESGDHATTIAAIRGAASVCFDDGAHYGVLGFSRGGFALAALERCETAGASWAVVAGAYGIASAPLLDDCPVAIVIGRGDRYHHLGAVEYAKARSLAGLRGELVEHGGGHRLDTPALVRALTAVGAGDARDDEGGGWFAIGELAALEVVVLVTLLVAACALARRGRSALGIGGGARVTGVRGWMQWLVLIWIASLAAILGVMPGFGLGLGPAALWPVGLAIVVAAIAGRRALWIACTSHGLAAAATLAIVRFIL